MSLLKKVRCCECGKVEEIYSVYDPIPTAPCLECQLKKRKRELKKKKRK